MKYLGVKLNSFYKGFIPNKFNNSNFIVNYSTLYFFLTKKFFNHFNFIRACLFEKFFSGLKSKFWEVKFGLKLSTTSLGFNRFSVKFGYLYKRSNLIQWFSRRGRFIFLKVLKLWLGFHKNLRSFKFCLNDMLKIKTFGFVKGFLNNVIIAENFNIFVKTIRRYKYNFFFKFYFKMINSYLCKNINIERYEFLLFIYILELIFIYNKLNYLFYFFFIF